MYKVQSNCYKDVQLQEKKDIKTTKKRTSQNEKYNIWNEEYTEKNK